MNDVLLSRFWGRVKKETKCWNWTGPPVRGYGKFRVGKKKLGVHRISWELHYGKIPDGLFVCHHCDNKVCVRPAHLFIGTHMDNMIDAAKKGRFIGRTGPINHNGARNPNAKLSEDQVSFIKKSTMPPTKLAEKFGVKYLQIYRIRRGMRWAN